MCSQTVARMIAMIIAILIIGLSKISAQEKTVVDWSEAGFSEFDARLWSDVGFSPADALLWNQAGFSWREASLWRRDAGSREAAIAWHNAGLQRSQDITRLKEIDVDFDTYNAWCTVGANHVETILSCVKAGFTLDDVHQLKALGFNSNDWVDLKRNGISYQEATQWSKLGLQRMYDIKRLLIAGINLQEAIQWEQSGIPGDWPQWKQAGLLPSEASKWAQAGITFLPYYEKCKHAGITINEATRWGQIKIPPNTYFNTPDSWFEWRSAGYTPEQASQWIGIGESQVIHVQEYLKAGFDLDTVSRWKQAGINSLDIILLEQRLGIKTPEEKILWDSLHVQDPSQWLSANIHAEEAKHWIDKGFDLVKACEWKSKGYTPESALQTIAAQQQNIVDAKRQQAKSEARLVLLLKVLFLVIVFLAISGLIFGFTNNAVFYYNKEDMFLSCSPIIVLVVTYFIVIITQWKVLVWIGLAISIFLGVTIFVRSFQYNKTIFASVSTAVAKFLLSFLVVLNILEALSPDGGTTSQKRYQRNSALTWLVFLTPLVYVLINGEKVVAKREVTQTLESVETQDEITG